MPTSDGATCTMWLALAGFTTDRAARPVARPAAALAFQALAALLGACDFCSGCPSLGPDAAGSRSTTTDRSTSTGANVDRPSDATGAGDAAAGDVPAAAFPTPAPLPTASASPALTRAIDRIVASAFDADAPGAAVLATQGGRVLYAAGRGLADRKTRAPIDVDTAFHVGSLGKQFTALAVLMLVDAGRLALDDPIGMHVPELRALGDDVTLRRLLGHTAGIPDVYDALYAATDARDAAAPGAPRNVDLVAAVADAVEGPDDLVFEPGTRYEYSNAGYDILGYVIERTSGQAYGDFLNAHVFAPLGMTRTFAWDPERLASAHRARGYQPTMAGGWTVVDHDALDALNGSGSIYTTVSDLWRYEQGLRAGTLLTPASAAEWTSPAALADGESTDYGLGWAVWKDGRETIVSHDGLWLGYSAYLARAPQRDLMVTVLSNNADADPETVGLAIGEAVSRNR